MLFLERLLHISSHSHHPGSKSPVLTARRVNYTVHSYVTHYTTKDCRQRMFSITANWKNSTTNKSSSDKFTCPTIKCNPTVPQVLHFRLEKQAYLSRSDTILVTAPTMCNNIMHHQSFAPLLWTRAMWGIGGDLTNPKVIIPTTWVCQIPTYPPQYLPSKEIQV